jgi:hypothetical protein
MGPIWWTLRLRASILPVVIRPGDASLSGEKRKHPRVREERYAALRVVADGTVRNDQGFCVVLDLSRGGVRLRSSVDVEVGATVEADIGFEEDIRTFPGVVRNSRPGPGRSHELGIQFDRLSEEAERFIERVLESAD